MRTITLEEINESPNIEGIFALEEEQYHKLKRVSSSALKCFLKSPKEATPYLCEGVEQDQKEFSPALIFGSAFHCLVLEPHVFDEKYIIEPIFSSAKNVNPGRQEWTAFKKTAVGRKIVSQKDWKKMDAMRRNLSDNLFYQKFISNMTAEVTMLWTDKLTGLKCKSRVDGLNLEMGIMDVKTMSEIPTVNECIRAIAKYDYTLQEVHYLNGMAHLLPEVPQNFRFLFTSKAGKLDNANIDIAASDVVFWTGIYRTVLSHVKSCQDENYYPGVSKEITEVKLPAWANDKYL